MHSPKKKYKVYIRNPSDPDNDTGRIIRYGGNELAEAQDLLGKPVAYFFWEFTTASSEDDEEKLLRILGDKEILILLYVGIRGGGGKKFSMEDVGDLIYTDFEAKRKYLLAIMCALSVAMTGKDPEALAEEATEKKAAKKEDADSDGSDESEEGEEASPNPT